MKNIEIEQKGTTLILKVDLSKDFGASKSGKSIVIASTEGNQKLAKTAKGEPVIVGLTVYTKSKA